MLTKQEYLLSIPFEYIIAFSRGTRLIRRNGYYTKKDFVQHLLRNLRVSECKKLYEFYGNGVSCRDAVKYFLEKYPTGELVSKAFVNHLIKTTKDLGMLMYEFPIQKTRVDILRISNFSYAYEVKSQRDRVDRLHYQLPMLGRIFESVYLVFSFSVKDKIKKMVDKKVGLYTYTTKEDQIVFTIEREPVEIDEYEPHAQLELFGMDELRSIYFDLYKEKPKNKVKRELINLFLKNIDRHEINLLFKKTIQKRDRNQTRSYMLMNRASPDGFL